MAFDREGAKHAGYTDEEIDAYLAKKDETGFLGALAPAAKAAVATGQRHIDAVPTERTLTELGGGIAGSLAAGVLTRGRGTAAGRKVGETIASGVARVAGAGAGGAGAEAGFQAATGEAFDAEKVQEAGVRQAGYEVLGQTAARILNRVIQPIQKAKVAPGTEVLTEEFKKVGGEFLPHQLLPEERTLGFGTGVAIGGIGGAGRMAAASAKQQEALGRLSENAADRLASKAIREMSDEEIGVILQDTLQGGKEAHATVRRAMYEALDQYSDAQRRPFVVALPKTTTDHDARTLSQLLNRTKPKDVPGVVPQEVVAAGLNFSRAQDLRSQLMALSGSTRAKDPVLARRYGLMAKELDQNIVKAVEGSGNTELIANWRAANEFYKDGKRVFDNKFIARLMSEGVAPEKVGERIAATGNVTTIKQVEEALRYAKQVDPKLNTKKAMDGVRAGWFNQQLGAAEATGELKAATLFTKLSQPKVQRTMRALYTPEQHKAIMDFAETAKIAQSAPKGGGDVMIKLTQPTQGFALGAMMLGGSAAGPVAVPIVLAPSVLSRLLTNPTSARWLTRGLSLPLSSPARGGLYTRILNAAVEIASPGEITVELPPGLEPGSSQSLIQERPQSIIQEQPDEKATRDVLQTLPTTQVLDLLRSRRS